MNDDTSQARAKCKLDAKHASKYLNKIQSSKARKVLFTLSLSQYVRILNTERCYYTGLPLCDLTLTLDRIDNSKGYEKGNVVACHATFNALKAIVENGNNDLTLKNCLEGFTKWDMY